jgi:hypothetical protein
MAMSRGEYDRRVRRLFVHQAVLELSGGADEQAPGAAVTVSLCGHWDHDGACRWPHHTAAERRSTVSVVLRTVFASSEGDEPEVRRRIVRALHAGRLDGPTGTSSWTVLDDGDSTPTPAERLQGQRWIAS